MRSQFTNLIDLNDFPVEWWDGLIGLSAEIYKNPSDYSRMCENKIMATLFYEPSTRTQMSFQAAMQRLGGTIIGFDNPETSSVAKGENLKDTAKVVSGYADIMVMRHPSEGSAKAAALMTDCPIINAGDGGHLHPTQTLTDLFTLSREKGRLDNLVVGLCGDLKNGRTVHSLCKALSCYRANKFILISTEQLRLPDFIKKALKDNGCEYSEAGSLEEAVSALDVLYMTRIQGERFLNKEEYNRQKSVFLLDAKKMRKAKEDLIVLHPLPRVDEIALEVDDDPRAKYFLQAKYGTYVRMALILNLLKDQRPTQILSGKPAVGKTCSNPNCITNKELYLPKSFIKSGESYECEYCSAKGLLTQETASP